MQTTKHGLEQQVSEIAELAKENKNVDVAALMASALQNHRSNLVPVNQKRLAFLVAIGAPPFGLLFALKFYFSDYDDGRHAAYMCIVLTVVSLILVTLFSKSLFSTASVIPEQVEQIKPSDVFQLMQ